MGLATWCHFLPKRNHLSNMIGLIKNKASKKYNIKKLVTPFKSFKHL